MAIAATAVWEIRSTGTSGDLNGGGFVSGGGGTDYSLQDAAQYNFTDLAATVATSAAPVVTSASHNFVAADVGNIMHITAGTNWTAGWYQIISCASNAATLDRACASVAGPSGGTFYVGGALSLNSALINAWSGTLAAGNKVWIKGNITLTSSISTPSAGTAIAPIIWEGYQTTRGDTPTKDNRPLLSFGANSLTLSSFWRIFNIRMIGTPATLLNNSSSTMFIRNSKFVNNSTTTSRLAVNVSGQSLNAIDCEFISYRGTALTVAGTGCFVYGCYIHDSNIGLNLNVGSAFSIINNIIESCSTKAIDQVVSIAANGIISGNTLYGSERKTGVGLTLITLTTGIRLWNNIIYGFTTGVTHADSVNGCTDDFNSFYNNTTNNTNWTINTNSNTVLNPSFTSVAQVFGTVATTSGSVLTDSSANFSNVTDNRDFCYIISGTGVTVGQYMITAHTTTTLTLDIAPGTSAVADKNYQVTTGRNFSIGTNLVNLGFPALFPSEVTRSYVDIGGVQRTSGGVYTDPGISNVKIATNYTFDSNALVGTYDGSDRHTDPGIANVRLSTAYKSNSTSNNRTGTLVLPAVADVRFGTSYDASSTGILDLPDIADVKIGIEYDNHTKEGTFPGADPEAIATAVWDRAMSSHTTAGTYGVFIKSLLSVAKFLGLK
jgi:hypothetical protein